MLSSYTTSLKWILTTFFVNLCFSQIFRLLFLLCSKAKFELNSCLLSIVYGLKFDVGVALIVSTIVLLVSLFVKLIKHENVRILIVIYFFFLLILIQSIFSIGDILLYKYWDSIFSIRAISYILNPSEIFKNVSNLNLSLTSVFILFHILIFHFLIKNRLKESLLKYYENSTIWLSIVLLLLLIPISFLAMRGGTREIPLNQSDAFFCQNQTYNIAAINSTWNFANTLVENQKYLAINPYQKMSDTEVQTHLNDLFNQKTIDTDIQLFDSFKKPNIVLITMEGVSAELLKYHNLTRSELPFLESLMDSSYYFSNAYSNGFRTEQGLAALLSGSLATPFNNITDNVNQLDKIPRIITTLKKRNYSTKFIFGGNLEFANMRAFLTQKGFDELIDINNFDALEKTQSLGVPDEYLFQTVTSKLNQAQSPFFVQVMTQSTHEPYDIPGANKMQNEKKLYLKSVNYLDHHLKLFMERERKTKRFRHTIYIFISDHSHRLPHECDIASKSRYHIPFVIYSPLLKSKYKGIKDSSLFSQHNFPATFSYLLGWKRNDFLPYSRNHFSIPNKFVMSSFVNGYLFQTDTGAISFDYQWRPFDTTNHQLVRAHKYPQALLQHLVDEIRLGSKPHHK